MVNTISLTVLVVVPGVGCVGGVPPSLVTILIYSTLITLVGVSMGAVNDLCAMSSTLPGFATPGLGLFIRVLPGTFAVTTLTTVRSLLSYIMSSEVVGSARGSGARLVTRNTNGVYSTLFNNVPTANTVTEATTGIGGNNESPVSNVIRTVILLLVLIILVPCTTLVPVPAVTTVLFIITCGVDR